MYLNRLERVTKPILGSGDNKKVRPDLKGPTTFTTTKTPEVLVECNFGQCDSMPKR